MIIKMERKHAPEVGKLHHKYVPSLLTDLGEKMCILFYENVIKSPNNFGFVYVEDSKVMGFIFGTEENSQLFRQSKIILGILFCILKKPSFIKQIILRMLKRLPSGAEISFIAVESTLRRKGLAYHMVIPMLEEFEKRNYSKIMNWIEENNKASLTLSLNAGSKIIGEFSEGGKRKFILDAPVTPILAALKQRFSDSLEA